MEKLEKIQADLIEQQGMLREGLKEIRQTSKSDTEDFRNITDGIGERRS